jgi:hypothetical protein
MFNLQLLNSQQYLLYLVRFSLSLVILYVDPRISLPRCLVNMVTSVLLSCLTEIINTDLAQVGKLNIRWISFHLYQSIFHFGHGLYSINIDIYVKQFLPARVKNLIEFHYIICEMIDDELIIYVLKIGSRGDVYK